MSVKSSISSHVRISYRFYEFVTTRYTTDFYIINDATIMISNKCPVISKQVAVILFV